MITKAHGTVGVYLSSDFGHVMIHYFMEKLHACKYLHAYLYASYYLAAFNLFYSR